jgi:hypothetical protein
MGDALSIYRKGRTGSAGHARRQAAKQVSDDLGVLDLRFHKKVSATAYERARCSLQHGNPVLASGWLMEAPAGWAGNRQQIARGHVVHLP